MSDIAERVKKIVVEHLGVEPDKVTENANFIDDLGADSLDTVELVMAFEEEFGVEIPDDAAETILTVGDAVKFLEKNGRLSHARRSASRHRAGPRTRRDRRLHMRRVVVTGTWHRHAARHAASKHLEAPDRRARAAPGASSTSTSSDLACQIACQVPRGDGASGTFNPDRLDGAEGTAQGRRLHHLRAWPRPTQALQDAGWKPEDHEEQTATGVMIGSGIGGLGGIDEASHHAAREGPAPDLALLHSRPADQPGLRLCLDPHGFKGPNHAVVTACSTGAHAIGDAARLIALGDADVMVAGGAESPVNRLALAGFAACRALSTGFNDDPTRASRPYDKDRDGFVMGEGAGVVVLEELEHAKARGAKIYAEVIGYGLSGDAYHITAPAEDGDGAFRCMAGGAEARRHRARATSTTSTPTAPRRRSATRSSSAPSSGLVGNAAGELAMSSTKSAIGHLLGAAGAVEAIFSILAIRDAVAPADHQPRQSLASRRRSTSCRTRRASAQIDVALSNSFGFGGTNASLVFRRYDA